MDSKLERRQCVKCQDYFAIVKSYCQDICYNCETEEEEKNLKCTKCEKPTPWRTLDINKQALCYSCSIRKGDKS